MPNICTHLKATLGPYVEHRALSALIGRLESWRLSENPTRIGIFLDYCKELHHLSILLLDGVVDRESFKLPLSGSRNIKVNSVDSLMEISTASGRKISLDGVYRNKALRSISEVFCGHHSPETRIGRVKAVCGLTKLKSALDPVEPDLEQWEEVFENISHTSKVSKSFTTEWRNFLRMILPLLLEKVECGERTYPKPLFIQAESSKMSTCYNPQTGGVSSKIRKDPTHKELDYLLSCREFRCLFRDRGTLFSNEFAGAVWTGQRQSKTVLRHPKYLGDSNYHLLGKIDEDSYPAGMINFIPEPGKKQRVVAQPIMALNSMVAPAGQLLKRINSSWKIQGVDSHANCCVEIHRRMDTTTVFHSIDMKSFTDYLPWEGCQRWVISELRKLGYLSLYDQWALNLIQGSSWVFPPEPDSQADYVYSVRYAGTPMGVDYSFPLASLTNGLIASLAYYQAKGRLPDNLDALPFRVIGDDIVIWDDRTAALYRHIMNSLGVIVSDEKCITSPFLVEFCSKMITPYGVFEMKKVKSPSSNYLDNCHFFEFYGPAIKEFNSDTLEQQYEYYIRSAEPFGAINPYVAELSQDPVTQISCALRKVGEIKSGKSLSEKTVSSRLFERLRVYGNNVPTAHILSGVSASGWILSSVSHRDPFKVDDVSPTGRILSFVAESLLKELNALLIGDHQVEPRQQQLLLIRIREVCQEIGRLYQTFVSLFPKDAEALRTSRVPQSAVDRENQELWDYSQFLKSRRLIQIESEFYLNHYSLEQWREHGRRKV